MLFGRPLMPSIGKSALKRRQIVAGGEPPFLSPLPGLGIVAGLTPGSAAARLGPGLLS